MIVKKNNLKGKKKNKTKKKEGSGSVVECQG